MSSGSSDAEQLREHLRRVAEVKAIVDTDTLTTGQRIERTIVHSQEHLNAFGASDAAQDEDFQVWRRINERLSGTAA